MLNARDRLDQSRAKEEAERKITDGNVQTWNAKAFTD
jgi:hypothetical protein